MKKFFCGRPGSKMPGLKMLCMLMLVAGNIAAQQFNSDSWLSKQHGTVTIIPTWGERNSMLMTTYSLFPKWEFTVAAYQYNSDGDPLTDDGHSATLYGKFMFYENKTKTGGASVKAGTGMRPGTITGDDKNENAFQSYWFNFPCTVPFFKNKLSVDLMPGFSLTNNYGRDKTTALGFTYSTRLAYYPFDQKWSAVGEMFGTEGEQTAIPEYKVGIRWEPSQYAVFAISYGQEFNRKDGAGFEIGIMLFSPPFVCFKGCRK